MRRRGGKRRGGRLDAIVPCSREVNDYHYSNANRYQDVKGIEIGLPFFGGRNLLVFIIRFVFHLSLRDY